MPLRITTANLNGIRAAARKGFFDWLARERPDVLCAQETKAQRTQLDGNAVYFPEGYHAYFHDAEKKGYSGVALYARRQPDSVRKGLGWPKIDCEGRWLEARFGKLSVVSFYMPSGTSGEERQSFKYAFMDPLLDYLKALRNDGREYIICGDWNIAHKPIDLKNWRANQNNSGFLPEERSWLDRLFGEAGFVDAFRLINPRLEQYTWWSFRGRAWEHNTGWRIDYDVITPALRARSAEIYTTERFSDHAPLTLEYDWEL
ncbi:MAG: exodeoxyribonuclease III [Nitrococcus sp.]|nr:exodeoxyribonuclease III [Nitrococcus sp.]